MDISEVSYFIEEAEDRSEELGVVSFSHACRSLTLLTHCVTHKILEDQESLILSFPYPEWFTLVMSRDSLV